MCFFSLIVPCYNCAGTIERLLDSVVKQGIKKSDFEVILCDDNSTDNWQRLAYPYRKKLNLFFVKAGDNDIHCPGNTRQTALNIAKGEWIIFADQDDCFERFALKRIKSYIVKSKERYCICTILRSWDPETNIFVPLVHKQAWLHGKCYNRANLIKAFNIHFKKDMETHEDIYFNSQVLAALYSMGIWDFTYYDINTYRWVENPDSITRSYDKPRGYLHENFGDYVIAAAVPFWEGAKRKKQVFLNQVMMTLLHSYFYYEGARYLHRDFNYSDNVSVIKAFLRSMLDDLELTVEEIVTYIMSDPLKYEMVRRDCIMAEGFFVESLSFQEFIEYLLL